MKRRVHLTAILLTAAMAAGLTGCGGGNNAGTAAVTDTAKETQTEASSAAAESTEKAAAGQEDKITITYWNTNRHDQEYMAPLIEEFNNTNTDNIYIDYQIYAENYAQMLDLSFSTDSAPDVYVIRVCVVELFNQRLWRPVLQAAAGEIMQGLQLSQIRRRKHRRRRVLPQRKARKRRQLARRTRLRSPTGTPTVTIRSIWRR